MIPETEIPNCFDYVGSKDIPVLWARQNFPVVALAFKFGEMKDNDAINMNTFTSELFPRIASDKSFHFVGLHLFVAGQEICHKDDHYCIVSEHPMLMCDLRTVFHDDEWQPLDKCLG